MSSLQLNLYAKSEQWELLREQLNMFANQFLLSKQNSFLLTLICEEWFFNIVNHGFPEHHIVNAEQSTVTMKIAMIDSNRVDIFFKDNGMPFNPFEGRSDEELTASVNQELGGLGLAFIIKLLDNYNYSYRNNQNQVEMQYVLK